MDKITSTNHDLFKGLNEEDCEIITGGQKKFTISNPTNYNVGYTIDGVPRTQKPNEILNLTAKEGILAFDSNVKEDVRVNRSYTLSDGKKYEFQNDPYSIDLVSV
nr:hypothetical protein [Nostoc sp. ChiQUE02]